MPVLFLFIYEVLFHGMALPRFVSSPVGGCLGCFHCLATMNNAAMKVREHISVLSCVFSYLGCVPRSGSLDHMLTVC